MLVVYTLCSWIGRLRQRLEVLEFCLPLPSSSLSRCLDLFLTDFVAGFHSLAFYVYPSSWCDLLGESVCGG